MLAPNEDFPNFQVLGAECAGLFRQPWRFGQER